jgi:hypothetical protein
LVLRDTSAGLPRWEKEGMDKREAVMLSNGSSPAILATGPRDACQVRTHAGCPGDFGSLATKDGEWECHTPPLFSLLSAPVAAKVHASF